MTHWGAAAADPMLTADGRSGRANTVIVLTTIFRVVILTNRTVGKYLHSSGYRRLMRNLELSSEDSGGLCRPDVARVPVGYHSLHLHHCIESENEGLHQ